MILGRIKNNKVVGIRIGVDLIKYQNEIFLCEKDYQNITNYVKPIYSVKNKSIIESATDEQLNKIKANEQLSQIKELNTKFETDGLDFYNEIKTEITLLLIGRSDAMALMTEIKQTIYPMLNVIKSGDFPLAIIDYTDNNNNPTIKEVIDLFNKVGQKAIQYYATEYPH